jgi:hypothetical protein
VLEAADNVDLYSGLKLRHLTAARPVIPGEEVSQISGEDSLDGRFAAELIERNAATGSSMASQVAQLRKQNLQDGLAMTPKTSRTWAVKPGEGNFTLP